jgi:hypothetical protein
MVAAWRGRGASVPPARLDALDPVVGLSVEPRVVDRPVVWQEARELAVPLEVDPAAPARAAT